MDGPDEWNGCTGKDGARMKDRAEKAALANKLRSMAADLDGIAWNVLESGTLEAPARLVIAALYRQERRIEASLREDGDK